MGFHRSNILITHLITLTMQILSVYVLHNNNNGLRLIRYLYHSAGRTLETQEKVSATLEKIGKVSKFSDPVEQGARKLWSWFSNFGSVATTVFSVQYVEAKIR